MWKKSLILLIAFVIALMFGLSWTGNRRLYANSNRDCPSKFHDESVYETISFNISSQDQIILYYPSSIEKEQGNYELNLCFEASWEDIYISSQVDFYIVIRGILTNYRIDGNYLGVINSSDDSSFYIFTQSEYSGREVTLNFSDIEPNYNDVGIYLLFGDITDSLARVSGTGFISLDSGLQDQCTAGYLTFGDFSFNFDTGSVVLPFDINNRGELDNDGYVAINFENRGFRNIGEACPSGLMKLSLNNGDLENNEDITVDNEQNKIVLGITEECLNALEEIEASHDLKVTASCVQPLCCESKSTFFVNLKDIPGVDLSPTTSFKGCIDFDKNSTEYRQCLNCLFRGGNPNGEVTGSIWTEIGCIDPSPAGIITRIFQIGLGLMGGVAVLRIIQIAYLYQQSDPQKVEEASSLLTSLIAGLILMILGVVILRFLGINILGLPQGFLGG